MVEMNNKRINVVQSSMPPFQEYVDEIKDIWDSRILTHQGPKYYKLEEEIKKYLGVKNVIMFSNGHMALELAIEALGLTGEIITTPYTFASTTQAIVRNHLTPVFCDINPDDYTIDPTKIESLITDKTSAIIPVHVYGNVCNVEAIEEIAKKHNLKVIYDAAHVFGAKIDNVPIGKFGDLSMFSFHATKVFHSVEGGCLCFDDDSLYEKLRELRQFGMKDQIAVPSVGTNAKMTEFHAAMGLCNLRHINEEINKRKLVFNRYLELLKGHKGIVVPQLKDNVTYNYAYFPVVFDGVIYNRDNVADKLIKHNIFPRKYFYPLTSDFEALQGKFPIQKTPIAEKVANNVLTLPLYADLSLEDVDRICSIILNEK